MTRGSSALLLPNTLILNEAMRNVGPSPIGGAPRPIEAGWAAGAVATIAGLAVGAAELLHAPPSAASGDVDVPGAAS